MLQLEKIGQGFNFFLYVLEKNYHETDYSLFFLRVSLQTIFLLGAIGAILCMSKGRL